MPMPLVGGQGASGGLQGQAPLTTPVLQSQSLALITPLRRRGLFTRPARGEPQLEAPVLSLAAAEEELHDSEAGSVIAFVHSEPYQRGRCSSHASHTAAGGAGSRRHQLYISFKYRRTVIHYEYYWVHLKAIGRQSRHSIFHAELRHFEILQEVFSSFVPMLRAWLSAIVKTANFIDQPVESVDLLSLLRVRHHLALTRRTQYTASVVLCKFDPESKKIVSKGIVFDFKARRVRDDAGTALRSFHEVFQQFLGLHLGHPLLPSPREEDEEEPHLAFGLLEGLEANALPELKMRRLLRLQGIVRRERMQRRNRWPPPDMLELMTTLLLPQLIHGAASGSAGAGSIREGPSGSAASAASVGAACVEALSVSATPRARGAEGAAEPILEAQVGEYQVLVCDVLADLCELHPEAAGPHVWRLCKGYLEECASWHACLLALGLLTLMSPRLSDWLVRRTDAATRLFSVFIEAHQFLGLQRDTAVTTGRGAQAVLRTQFRSHPEVSYAGLPGSTFCSAGGSRALARAASGDWMPPLPPSVQLPGEPCYSSSSTLPPPLPEPRGEEGARACREPLRGLPTGSAMGAGSHTQTLHAHASLRAPSFDNFEDPYAIIADTARTCVESLSGRSGEEATVVVRQRPNDVRCTEDAAAGTARSDTRNARPVRVPPLNLDLASRLPSNGGAPSCGAASSDATTPSMTRSSRRLRQSSKREHPPARPGSSLGSASRSPVGIFSSMAHSLSAPLLGLRFVSGYYILPDVAGGPPQQAGSSRSHVAGVGERQSMQQADDLAKALGEACLLADLGDLLKHKQERQVHDAVMDSIISGKSSSCTTTPRTNPVVTQSVLVRPPPGTPGYAQKTMSSVDLTPCPAAPPRGTASGYGTPVSGMVAGTSGQSTPGHSANHFVAPSPRLPACPKLTGLRKVRLHASLVLERLCACTPIPVEIIGPQVPVNRIFEMLLSSTSRSGASSFSFDDEDHLDATASLGRDVVAGVDSAAVAAPVQPLGPLRSYNGLGGILQQRLEPDRLRCVLQLQERLQKSSTLRRCVCGVASTRGAAEEHCTCLDDPTAACLWRFLALHARHVEAVTARPSAPPSARVPGFAQGPPGQEALLEATRVAWDCDTGAWHARLGLNPFLSRLARAVGQALMQLKCAQSGGPVGPEVVSQLQQRLSFLLRLSSTYLRRCGGRTLPMQSFQTLCPVLAAVKCYLCSSADATIGIGPPIVPAAAVRVWVSYLQLVGVILRSSVSSGGLHCAALGEVVLIELLDFQPPPSSSMTPRNAPHTAVPPQGHAAAAASTAPASAYTTSPSPSRGRVLLEPGAVGMPRSLSLRKLGAAPPRMPTPCACCSSASPGHNVDRFASAPATSAGMLAGAGATTPGTAANVAAAATPKALVGSTAPRSAWNLLPRILERTLLDASLEEVLAPKRHHPGHQHPGACEDGAEVIRCRALAFIEGLLEFSRAVASSVHPGGADSAVGLLGGPVEEAAVGASSGPVGTCPGTGAAAAGADSVRLPPEEVPSFRSEVKRSVGNVVGVHDDLYATMSVTGEALASSILEWLRFLFLPPWGLLCRLAKKLPLAGSALGLRLVLCERALFRTPAVAQAVYIREAAASEYYVRRHFLAFVRLYNSRAGNGADGPPVGGTSIEDAQIVHMCRLHVQTLLAIASLRSEGDLPRRAFHQLSVLDFLAGEIDLEHETTQMRDRFLRAAHRQASQGRVGSNSSTASCTVSPASAAAQCSGPSNSGASGRTLAATAAVGALLASSGVLGQSGFAVPPSFHCLGPPPVASATPPEPPAPPPECEPANTNVRQHASLPRPAPSVRMSMPASGGRPRPVPKLQFRGIRPSLQGTSGLGAAPPEEPGFGDYVYFAAGTANAPMPNPATTVPSLALTRDQVQRQNAMSSKRGLATSQKEEPHFLYGVPKLSFAGLSGDALRGAGAALAPVADDPGDSGTGSTLASPGAAGSMDERPTPWHHRQDGPVPPTGAGSSSGGEVSDPPRRPPPVVPKLSIQMLGDAPGSACAVDGLTGVAGEGGVVETPPTSRSSPINGAQWSPAASTPFSSACGSARRSARFQPQLPQGLINDLPGTNPPISHAPVSASERHKGLQCIGAAAPTCAVGHVAPLSDSSDETSPRSAGSAAVPAGSKTSQQRRLLLTCTPAPKRAPVPALSFLGLRPSLQGCSGLGAPPPEEPSIVNGCALQQEAIAIIPLAAPPPLLLPPSSAIPLGPHALSPPPPSNSDSEDSSDRDVEASATGEETGAPPDPRTAEEPQEAPALCDSSDEDGEVLLLAGAAQSSTLHHAAYDTAADLDSSDDDEVAGADVASATDARPEAATAPLSPDALRPGPGLQMPTRPGPGAEGRPGPAAGLMQRGLSGPAVPKLAFNGLRPSLQGCTGLGAPPPEEPTHQELAALTRAAPPSLSAPVLLTQTAPSLEAAACARDGATTPTGSGQHSPMAGSAASAHLAPTDLSCASIINQNVFYFEGRQRRRIYDDDELHALMLTLILALLVTPQRGLLDPRYCDQYPHMNHQRNIPFLLSVHVNHSANAVVLPWLFQLAETLGRIGGFRILKLLCETAMHRWMYTNWNRIAGGTFGTVYRCSTQLSEEGTVAVKQIPKQSSIQDRCVFYDVFNEVACLDAIRFEGDVCQLFDYGTDESGYWIVMKYYPTTLKKWRSSLRGSLTQNLPVLVAVYRQVLQAISVLHRHGIVHYDLKCDNIMIDLDKAKLPGGLLASAAATAAAGGAEPVREDGPSCAEAPSFAVETTRRAWQGGEWLPQVALADFGESRMMTSAEELDTRNRGTEIVKCPEMLELEKFGKKEGNCYDRRKRVGTNSTADIWSLGCLLFELLTGRYLFQDDDFGMFWARVTGRMTGRDRDVLSEANEQLLEGCMPLVEFIRYMLVRDPQRRPTIAAAVHKFRAAADDSLRWRNAGMQLKDGMPGWPTTPNATSRQRRDSAADTPDSPRSVARSVGGSSGGGPRTQPDVQRPDRPLICAAVGDAGSYSTRVLADLYVLEASDVDLLASCALPSLLAQRAWTHVIDFRAPGAVPLPCQLHVPYTLALPWSSPGRPADEFLCLLPVVFDFLRHAAISRGEVLFLDGHSAPGQGQDAAAAQGLSKRGGVATAAVLAVLAETCRLDVFATLSYLSSQILVAAIRPDALSALAIWQESVRRASWARSEGTARIACICGCCSWHVPPAWLAEAPEEPPEVLQAAAGESYLRWLHARFGLRISGGLHWLWLPQGMGASDCSDGPSSGSLSCGMALQAERLPDAALLPPPPQAGSTPAARAGSVVRRFRCRTCRALTHAEVLDPSASAETAGAETDGAGSSTTPLQRVALVCSYELLRLARIAGSASTGEGSPSSTRRSYGYTQRVGPWGRALSEQCSERPVSCLRRPPVRLHATSLAELMLPQAA